jgi:hypothetical protein
MVSARCWSATELSYSPELNFWKSNSPLAALLPQRRRLLQVPVLYPGTGRISFRLQMVIVNSLTRHVKSNSRHNLAALPRALLLALIVLPAIDMAVELHIHNDIVTLELPRVEVEPVIGDLNLVSIDDLLLKDTVSVTKTVSPGWVVQRGHRVEEAGGETTETAVAERGVVLLGNDIFHAEAKVGETLWKCIRKANGRV